MRRTAMPTVVGALAVAAVLALGTAVTAAPSGVAGDARPGAAGWTPCPDNPGFDCATVTVPVDWAHPVGPMVNLALARSRATDPARRIGSLVVNPGGPGVSGVDFVMRVPPVFSADLRARFDIVGFDPRGIKRSRQVRCDAGLVKDQEGLLYPRDPGEFATLRKVNAALGESCEKHSGALVEHMDTASVVRDLEQIRAALDEGDLTYVGGSYGTLIGQQYAELFPGNIRAMALDANIDHSLDVWSYEATSAVAIEEAFGQFADWCQRTAGCALHDEDVRAFFDKLYARAERGEVVEPGNPPVVITPQHILDTVLNAMANPFNSWFGLADQLAAWAAGKAPGGARRQPERAEPVEFDYLPVLCEDFELDVDSYQTLARFSDQLDDLAPHMRLNTLAWTDLTGCQNWPTELSNPQHPLQVVGAPPILISNARYDPATPYSWAKNVASQIGSAAVLLTYDGVGHSTYRLSPCARSAIDHYLTTRQTPPQGTHCPALFPTEPPAGQPSDATTGPLSSSTPHR
jgi:pimeloyl-ACP methyl ester carboxylesterase